MLECRNISWILVRCPAVVSCCQLKYLPFLAIRLTGAGARPSSLYLINSACGRGVGHHGVTPKGRVRRKKKKRASLTKIPSRRTVSS